MIKRLLPLLLLPATGLATDESVVEHLVDQANKRVPTNTVAPVYPEVARRDRVQGDVQVCFNVDRKGRPYRIAVRSSTNRVFEKPSMRAVRASRYAPVPDEREVPAIKTCRTFQFRLERVNDL
jgi:TonB family protein